MLKGPGPFQPAIAWDSAPTSLKSEKCESTIATSRAFSAMPAARALRLVAMEIAALERDVVRQRLERRRAAAELDQVDHRDAVLRRDLDPDEPVVVRARRGDDRRAAARHDPRHQLRVARAHAAARGRKLGLGRRRLDDDPRVARLSRQRDGAGVRGARRQREDVARRGAIDGHLQIGARGHRDGPRRCRRGPGLGQPRRRLARHGRRTASPGR